MKSVMLAVVAAIALPVWFGAEAQTVVTRVTGEDLVRYVERAGHTVNEVGTAEIPAVTVAAPGDFIYLIQGNACDEVGCQGLKLLARFDGASGIPIEELNTYNYNVPATKFWKSEDVMGLERYLILNGGLTEENIVYELQTFNTIVPRMVERLKD